MTFYFTLLKKKKSEVRQKDNNKHFFGLLLALSYIKVTCIWPLHEYLAYLENTLSFIFKFINMISSDEHPVLDVNAYFLTSSIDSRCLSERILKPAATS